RQPLLLDVAHMTEAGLLEGAPRTAVALLAERERDACGHDLRDELRDDLPAEPDAVELFLSDQAAHLAVLGLHPPPLPASASPPPRASRPRPSGRCFRRSARGGHGAAPAAPTFPRRCTRRSRAGCPRFPPGRTRSRGRR